MDTLISALPGSSAMLPGDDAVLAEPRLAKAPSSP